MPESYSERARRRRHAWVKFLIGAAMLVLLIVGGVYMFGWAETHRWERYAAKLRAAGEPLTFEEIDALRTPAVGEPNGALVLGQLREALESIGKSAHEEEDLVLGRKGPDIDFFKGMPRYAIEPSRAFIAEHRGLLDELSVLPSLPAGRFGRPVTDNVFAVYEPLAALRDAGKLQFLEATLKLIDGNLTGATDCVHIQFCIAGTLNEHPSIIGSLVQTAIDATALNSVENILRVGEVDEATLAGFDQTIKAREAVPRMKWALRGERACFHLVCERLIAGEAVSPDRMWVQTFGWLPEGVFRREQIAGADLMTRLIEVSDDPSGLMAVARQIDAEVAQLSGLQVLVKTFNPSMARATVLHARLMSEFDCMRAVLAAERFRLQTGRLPTSLDELVPQYLEAVPADPFDGQPMRFTATDEGIVIYSVSENLVDDGGSVTSDDRKKAALDVGCRLLKPEHRGLLLTDEPPPEDWDAGP